MSDSPVYVIANLVIDDSDRYREYEKGFFPLLKRHDGKLITLDHDSKIVKIAIDFFKKGNLENKIQTIVAPALDSLQKIIEEKKKFDLIFIDADKQNYINYYEKSLNLVNKGALIIFDNVLWHGDVYKDSITDKQTNVMRNFNKFIKNDKRIEKFILPIGDGFTICRKS